MSCSDVCISHDYDGRADFSSTKTVTAKKGHVCVECGESIRAGERYERCSGKWDGDMMSIPTCCVCAEVRDAFVCGGYVFGMLWESLVEEMFPVWRTKGAWECLAKLTSETALAECNRRYREWLDEVSP